MDILKDTPNEVLLEEWNIAKDRYLEKKDFWSKQIVLWLGSEIAKRMNKGILGIFVCLFACLAFSKASSAAPMKDIGLDSPDAAPMKDIGLDSPDSMILGGTWNSPFQVASGDINGNKIKDLVVIGSLDTKLYVGVYFDVTTASLNRRNFASPDFIIKTAKSYPWASDVLKFHPMNWLVVTDLNQDGFDDIVFSLPIVDMGNGMRDEKGEVYVVLGNTRANLGVSWDFAVKPPSFTFFGRDPGDRAGFSLATGDINGDGRKDLLIGAPQADGPNNAFLDGGEIYVLTRIDWNKSSMILAKANVDLYLYGETGQEYGYAMTTGNINGDVDSETGAPIDDIIVASYISPGGPVKIIFGKNSERRLTSSDWTSSYNLIPRLPNLTAGDLNRDGIDDLVGSGAGEVSYVTYGSRSSISLSPDVTINSAHIGDRFGFSNVISDFDGDGFKDLAILAPGAIGKNNQYTTPVGEAHVIWGSSTKLPFVINLASEATHFTIYGSNGSGPTGLSSNFQGPWNSAYGYIFGMEFPGGGKTELFFGGSWNQNLYLYKVLR